MVGGPYTAERMSESYAAAIRRAAEEVETGRFRRPRGPIRPPRELGALWRHYVPEPLKTVWRRVPRSIAVADGGRPICIAQPRVGLLTETFIEAHVQGLPGPVVRLHGEPFPLWDGDGRPLASPLGGAVRRVVARALGLEPERLDQALVRALGPLARDRALARSLRRLRVSVVLAEYGPTGVALARACGLAQIPLVVHFHGYDAAKHRVIAEHGEAYRAVFARAAAVVAVSRSMRRQLIALGAPPERVALIPYGVEVDPAAPRADPGAAPPSFLAVGRFVDKKAPHLTLLAFSRVARAVPEATLQMIGDGPLREACTSLAQALGITARVAFPGALPPADVATAMAAARCFVQHSVRPASGDMEGTPLAVLEAMAAGLPVVSTRHGGIADAVDENVTGYLVDEGDVPEMANAMLRLAAAPELAAGLGREGWRRALAEYRREDRLRELAALLQRAASDGR